MYKIKHICLRNYCGYIDFDIDFTNGKDINKWLMLSGPNGIGKSNFLNAINLLCSPSLTYGRKKNDMFFRKLTYNKDYDPTYVNFSNYKPNLYMEAIFDSEDGDKKVVIENNWDDKVGLTNCDLESDVSYYIDADKPNNLNSFQIRKDFAEEFLDMASSVYGFLCELPDIKSDVENTSYGSDFYTDFILHKAGTGTSFSKKSYTKVHYKAFSAGEKKIATLLCNLFAKKYSEKYGRKDYKNSKIILIDNIEMHIHYKRHLTLLKMIEKYFGDCQIVATTHSPIIMNNMHSRYLVDLEEVIQGRKKNKVLVYFNDLFKKIK